METLKRKRVDMLISDKVNFRTKKTTGDKEGHCLMRKESVLQERSNFKCKCPEHQSFRINRAKLITIRGFNMPNSAIYKATI